MENLVALARALGDVPVLHTSTCYVAGYRRGRIPEVDPRACPTPASGEMPDVKWDPQREIAEGLDITAASIKRHADDATASRPSEQEAQGQPRAQGGAHHAARSSTPR
jgi:long-chain acyl-CoA synthetase